jgi:L-iditol 2-dehydrogenase
MSMLALVKTAKGKGNIELRTVEEPKVGKDEVKIQVRLCGICTTDLHILNDTIDYNPPVILGHEISGVITEVGSQVKRVKVGDRVAADSHGHVCNTCGYCQKGILRYCLERTMVGRHKNGGFADYFVTKESFVTLLDEKIDFISGSMTQPLYKITHCLVERCGIQAGTIVVIIGTSPTGILALQVAKASGATVVLVDTGSQEEILKFKEFGADLVIPLNDEIAKKHISELTSGYGADCVIECSGSQEGLTLGVALVKKLGKLLQLGIFGSKVEINMDYVVSNGIEIIGAAGTTWTAKQKTIELLRTGKIKTRELVSDILPITSWKEGFQKVAEKSGKVVMLDPTKK